MLFLVSLSYNDAHHIFRRELIAYMIFLLTVSMSVFGIVAIEIWHTQMPVWAFFLAVLICTSEIFSWFAIYNILLIPPDHSALAWSLIIVLTAPDQELHPTGHKYGR